MVGRTTRLHGRGKQEELNMSQTACRTGNTMHAVITTDADEDSDAAEQARTQMLGCAMIMMNMVVRV